MAVLVRNHYMRYFSCFLFLGRRISAVGNDDVYPSARWRRRLRDDSHKNQFLLGRFDRDGSHKISNGTVRTNLLGRFSQN